MLGEALPSWQGQEAGRGGPGPYRAAQGGSGLGGETVSALPAEGPFPSAKSLLSLGGQRSRGQETGQRGPGARGCSGLAWRGPDRHGSQDAAWQFPNSGLSIRLSIALPMPRRLQITLKRQGSQARRLCRQSPHRPLGLLLLGNRPLPTGKSGRAPSRPSAQRGRPLAGPFRSQARPSPHRAGPRVSVHVPISWSGFQAP